MMLSEEHAGIRDVARRFADEVVRPAAAALDEAEKYPIEVCKRTAGLGLFGVAVPEEDKPRRIAIGA